MGVRISIGKNRFIVSDEFQYWMVQECKSQKTGETYDKRISGFHVSLDNLINSYDDRHLKTSDIETLADFGKEIKKLQRENAKWWKAIKEGAT